MSFCYSRQILDFLGVLTFLSYCRFLVVNSHIFVSPKSISIFFPLLIKSISKMQYSILLVSFLSSVALSAPTLSSRQIPSADDISAAANAWAAETDVVSQFISAASTLSGSALTTSASNALSHEVDELTHKAVLDMEFGPGGPEASGLIVGANNILVTDGTFQVVVDGLRNLATNGATMSVDEVNGAILAINTDRCGRVLPAIDTYLAAASKLSNLGTVLLAGRPNNCPGVNSS